MDRAETSLTYLFDKLVVVDVSVPFTFQLLVLLTDARSAGSGAHADTQRWAAHRHGQETQVWNKATCDLPLLRVPSDWWKPLRDSMRRLAVADGCHLARSKSSAPVVTYINRSIPPSLKMA